ncbi:hypothetical protein U14_03825 [Candidatus Moduliflexus flocculans]|uniref:Uncharacterized protein n=1 Tax=Candidatus Moduliflexus flocculans TaxID=1499966 RepID=A0A081BQA7_9BACT|nr:hypothetical protein U14_03825 [Candidatus Moduliflexus flocculans]
MLRISLCQEAERLRGRRLQRDARHAEIVWEKGITPAVDREIGKFNILLTSVHREVAGRFCAHRKMALIIIDKQITRTASIPRGITERVGVSGVGGIVWRKDALGYDELRAEVPQKQVQTFQRPV